MLFMSFSDRSSLRPNDNAQSLHCALLPLSCHYTELKTDSLLCYWLITRLQWLTHDATHSFTFSSALNSLNSTELGSRYRFGIQGPGILREFSRAYWSATSSSDSLSLVCFTMMSMFKTIQSRIVGWLVYNELEKKRPWPNRHLPERTEENHEKCQYSWWADDTRPERYLRWLIPLADIYFRTHYDMQTHM